MIVYSHNYVTLADICKHNDLNYSEVLQAVCESDVCFGTNEDTLICRRKLQDIMDDWNGTIELDWGKLDDSVLISLGS